ncbi:MAG: response regulator [Deltaproteobacteria bacterium]|nr:response regulator [Deltaproteobacteria bacterium]
MKGKQILVVEDEGSVALDIKKRLQTLGYGVSGIASSGEETMEMIRRNRPDLVLMDIQLCGGMDGVDTAGQILASFHIPVVYLTAYADPETLERAKVTDPFGYILKPFETKELRVAVEMALYKHGMDQTLRESRARLERSMKGAIDAIAAIIELRGPFVAGHHRRVSRLAAAIAEEMGLSGSRVEGIRLTAGIYDIGLVHLPAEILMDAGRLEGAHLDIYQTYPQIGCDILNNVEFPWPIAETVLQHRECFDGSGFPGGVKGGDILLEARILAVADAVTSLTSRLAYRPALEMDAALEELKQNAGALYDPEVVEACLRLFRGKGFQFNPDGRD